MFFFLMILMDNFEREDARMKYCERCIKGQAKSRETNIRYSANLAVSIISSRSFLSARASSVLRQALWVLPVAALETLPGSI